MSEKAPLSSAKRETTIRTAIKENDLDLPSVDPASRYDSFMSPTALVRRNEPRGEEDQGRIRSPAVAEAMAYAAKPLLDEVIGLVNDPERGFLPRGMGVTGKDPVTGNWKQHTYSDLLAKVVEANQQSDQEGVFAVQDERRAKIENARSRHEDTNKDSTYSSTPETKPTNETEKSADFFNGIAKLANKVTIFTSLPRGTEAIVGEKSEPLPGGLHVFGDGASSKVNGTEGIIRYSDARQSKVVTPEGGTPSNLVETVQFVPETKDIMKQVAVERTRYVKKGLFGKELEKYTENIDRVVGTEPIMMSDEHGKEVPAVRFRYSFDLSNMPGDYEGSVAYRDYSGRDGNHLFVQGLLPESTVRDLQVRFKNEPTTAVRQFAEAFVTQRGGIPESYWSQGDEGRYMPPIRPPYEDLPPEHTIKLIESSPDQPDKWVARSL